MAERAPRYTNEEFERRGGRIYEESVLPYIEPEHLGNIVAIDIETGAWEFGDDELKACDRLMARIPDCQTWLVRVGEPYLRRRVGARRGTHPR